MKRFSLFPVMVLTAGLGIGDLFASEPDVLQSADVFDLEYAADPQISPDGTRVVYARTFMDVMTDRRRSNLWIVSSDGTNHRSLTSGNENHRSPRWSPDGNRLLYVSDEEGSSQIYCRWMDTGQTAKITRLPHGPQNLRWSPDGRSMAFSMLVSTQKKPFATMPTKPKGAKWADPPIIIDRLSYRADGAGYLPEGFFHLFVLPADGGTARQVTSGDFHHRRAAWAPDSKSLIFSANRQEDWEYRARDTEVYEVNLADLTVTQLTDREGPDNGAAISPDGGTIAFVGFDDRYQGYQVAGLYLMNRGGSVRRLVSGDFDRSIEDIRWHPSGEAVLFRYDDEGNTKIGSVDLAGAIGTLAADVGGLSLGRPYGAGSYSVSDTGAIAYTLSRPEHPADVAVRRPDGEIRRLTNLNADVFGHKELAATEEINFASSFDGREIQGWVTTPPDFDPKKKYPLILEIHGGPFANYGDRFAAEFQLYAAAGYVVLAVNPRGSTSYGEEFGNLIHHNYPSQDYDDLMSGVDAVIAQGFIDSDRLYVTGGSGGGVLSAWIVGKTDRFAAAVVAKPVINWVSFSLTADLYPVFTKYWFPGPPWEHFEHYMKRSPLSMVGNVTTPTMLLTGEEDYRTPMAESEQYYQALKLRKIDTVLVRIPGASHGIGRRPSQLIAKVVHVLKWFELYGGVAE